MDKLPNERDYACRYARMTPEERRAHNNRRRMRQMQNALAAVKVIACGLIFGID